MKNDRIGGVDSILWESKEWRLTLKAPSYSGINAMNLGAMFNPYQMECTQVVYQSDADWSRAEVDFGFGRPEMEMERLAEARQAFNLYGLKKFHGCIDDVELFPSLWNLINDIKDDVDFNINHNDTIVLQHPQLLIDVIDERIHMTLKTPEAINRMLIFSGYEPLRIDGFQAGFVESIEVDVDLVRKKSAFGGKRRIEW